MQSDPAHDELVEKVARAICDAEWDKGHYDSDAMSKSERGAYEALARAALAVARPVIREECARVAEF